ncbi:MAG: NAD-dependent epimerase/dehydratase family protein [Chloroflexi bacterium]|nr:MAG: NAD-dependent epimerase/dehydratase family protein [Chloroflexota bacterium]
MILVVGATGNLGGMITRGLLARGKDVRILVREGRNYAPFVSAGATPFIGDLKDRASLDAACQDVDTVVTTATAIIRQPPDTIESVDDLGYRNLIEAAKAAGVRHFVFTSALGSSLDSESGMTYTVLMPNLYIEVWAGIVVAAPLAQGKPVTLVGEASHRHSMVAMRDAASFAIAAIDNPAARNATIVIGGPEPVSWTDVVLAAERIVGHQIETRSVAPGESIEGLPPGVSGMFSAMETYDSAIDMDETARTFGVTLTRIEEGLRTILQVPVAG